MSDVVKIVNAIRPKGKTSRLFSKLCNEMSADHNTPLLHSEVRCLSQGKVLQRVLLLRNELYEFLKSHNDECGVLFEDEVWISKLCCMAVLNHLNQRNLSLQGEGGNIFDVSEKIESMKLKINFGKPMFAKTVSQTFRIWKTISKNATGKIMHQSLKVG